MLKTTANDCASMEVVARPALSDFYCTFFEGYLHERQSVTGREIFSSAGLLPDGCSGLEWEQAKARRNSVCSLGCEGSHCQVH